MDTVSLQQLHTLLLVVMLLPVSPPSSLLAALDFLPVELEQPLAWQVLPTGSSVPSSSKLPLLLIRPCLPHPLADRGAMHSHHSHSGLFCSHAHPGSTPETMLARATELGFHTYGLSEHVPRQHDSELYPEEREEGTTPAKLMEKWKAYLVEARRVQSDYKGKGKGVPRVLVGAETENLSPSTLAWLKADVLGTPAHEKRGAAVGKGVVDYLVGSLHHAGGFTTSDRQGCDPAIPIDFDAATFHAALEHFGGDGRTEEEAHLRLCLAYFDAQYRLIDELRPEVIGHFDLCRLFRPQTTLIHADDEAAATQLQLAVSHACTRNIRLAASYGALFEINSASLRKGWATPYPAPDVLREILRLGGRVCLSDDAHGPSHVAISYRKARSYLREMGVEKVWCLELDEEAGVEEDEAQRRERELSDRPGEGGPTRFARGTRARAVTGWAEDVFWTNLEKHQQ